MPGYRTFFREFRRHFHTTGAVLPSSRFLASALARYVRRGREDDVSGERRILEVGPGTGSVTDRIVAAMRDDDRLDLVEVNDEFVALLRRRFETEAPLQAVADRVRIFHQRVEEMRQEEPYDLVVSGLPLNNFSAEAVEQILDVFAELLRAGGRLSFFEYIGIRAMRTLVSGKAERQRLRGIGAALGSVLSRHEIRRQAVWVNVPPAWVHHVEFPARDGNGRPE